MFDFPVVTDLMLGIFVGLFWHGAILAGSRFFSGPKGGTIGLGFGPDIFDLHLNRFRYRIHLVPIGVQTELIPSVKGGRSWVVPLITAGIAVAVLTAMLAFLDWAILAPGPPSVPVRELTVRQTTQGGMAAAGLLAGDALRVESINELVARIKGRGETVHLTVERNGVEHDITIQPIMSGDIIQPLGLTIVAPAGKSTAGGDAAGNLFKNQPSLGLQGWPDRPYGIQACLLANTAAFAVALLCLTLVLVASHATETHLVTAAVLLCLMLWNGHAWYTALAFLCVYGIPTFIWFPIRSQPVNLLAFLVLLETSEAISKPIAFFIVTHSAQLHGANMIWAF